MLKLVIQGIAEFDPFGIPFFKRNVPVDQTFDLGTAEDGKQFTILSNTVTVGVAIQEANDALDVDIKVAVFGVPILDKKVPLIEHVSAGPRDISEGSPQLGFKGTVQLIDSTSVSSAKPDSTGTTAESGTVAEPAQRTEAEAEAMVADAEPTPENSNPPIE